MKVKDPYGVITSFSLSREPGKFKMRVEQVSPNGSTHLKIFYCILYLKIGPWLNILLTVLGTPAALLYTYERHRQTSVSFVLLYFLWQSKQHSSLYALCDR